MNEEKSWRGTMEDKLCRRDHVGDITGRIMEGQSWRRNFKGGVLQEK